MSKNKIAFWATLGLIAAMLIAVFVPMTTMRGHMADAVEKANKQFNEDFTLTWSNIDEHPLKNTFIGIMKSNATGITYDIEVKDGEISMDYETENFNAKINDEVEKSFSNSFSLAAAKDDVLDLRIMTTQVLQQDKLKGLAEKLKASFEVKEVKVETIQLSTEDYKTATEHIAEYYQRSTIEHKAFDEYEPTRTKYTF